MEVKPVPNECGNRYDQRDHWAWLTLLPSSLAPFFFHVARGKKVVRWAVDLLLLFPNLFTLPLPSGTLKSPSLRAGVFSVRVATCA